MKSVIAIVLLASIAWTVALLAQAPGGDLKALVDDVDRNFAQMKDFSADFIQISSLSKTNLNQTRKDSGHLYLAKGHKMYFEYKEPEQRLWVSNGKTIYSYDPEERTSTKTPVKESDAEMLPLMGLVGQSGLKDKFNVTELKREPLFPGNLVIQLQLKKKSEDIKEIEIEVDPQRKLIVRMQIVDTTDLRHQFIFSNIQTNSRIPDSRFEFTPPTGTRILRGAGSQ